MNWFEGPISDQAIFWLGLKVFWWKRLVSAVQILVGSSVLLTLLTREQKLRIDQMLAKMAGQAKTVRVPPPIRLRTIAKYMATAIVVVATTATLGLASYRGPTSGTSVVGMFVVFSLLLTAIAVPLAGIAVSLSVAVTSVRFGQRYLPRALAWLGHSERIDRTLVVLPFVILVAVSVFGMFLN